MSCRRRIAGTRLDCRATNRPCFRFHVRCEPLPTDDRFQNGISYSNIADDQRLSQLSPALVRLHSQLKVRFVYLGFASAYLFELSLGASAMSRRSGADYSDIVGAGRLRQLAHQHSPFYRHARMLRFLLYGHGVRAMNN